MAFLQVENIQKAFGATEVLKGIDFTLEEGEVLSIIGSSGNGKTTLLRCLNFLERADQGRILVNGDVIFDATVKMNETAIREKRLKLGLVFQSFNLFPQYTALENVSLALNLREEEGLKNQKLSFLEKGKKKKEIREKNRAIAMEILEKVGLKDKADLYPCALSGGQQQRVAIARAMALKPEILCFDEPTSALDPELTGEVLKVIKELKETSNITMIIVTHEMEFAKNISDKVLFLAEGQVEAFGTPKEIFVESTSPVVKAFLTSDWKGV